MSDSNKKIADLLTKAAQVSTEAADFARRGKVEKALELERQADELRALARRGRTVKPKKRTAARSSTASVAATFATAGRA